MSFSSTIKEEILNKLDKKTNRNDKKKILETAETFGELLTSSKTKNELLDRFKDFFLLTDLDEEVVKAVLKGAFLGSGCISDPHGKCHFEIILRCKSCADYIFNLLSVLDFTPRIMRKKRYNLYSVYVKDSEQISMFLSLIEASSAKLKFEQIRVEKEFTNNINRKVNCETANLTKLILSSQICLEAIQKIKRTGNFDKLPEKLKETAFLREKYPEDSLEFLALIASKKDKISKSGIKHRLDKLILIAGDIDE